MEASSEHAYLFRHAVLQEVACQLQPPSQRSQLHGWSIGIMEELFPESLEEHALVLADHAFRAHQDETSRDATRSLRGKEVRYPGLAAGVARRRYDNTLVIELFRRLGELANEGTH